MQLQLHYSTQHYANYITLRYNYSYNYTTVHNATVHNARVHYTTLHYTNYTTPQLQLQLQLHYTALQLQLQLDYTTLQLQLQLRYATLHPAVVGEVTTAATATTPNNTTPTTFRSISGFVLPSMHHNNSPLQSLNLPPPPCATLLVYLYIILFPADF